MGAKSGRLDLSPEDIERYYRQAEHFQHSGCVNLEKLKLTLGAHMGNYCQHQISLASQGKDLAGLDSYTDFKKVARSVGVADGAKRSFIMQLFDLKPAVCATKYAVGLKIASAQWQQ